MTQLARQAILDLLTSKPFQKRLGRLFSHPITLLAIATVFATIAGVWLTNYYQERAWVREKQFETFRQGYAEALKLVDEVSELMSRRFFGLNRVVWAAKGTGTGDLERVWEEYYQSVIEWNAKLLTYTGRLARFVGPEAATAFAHRQDATQGVGEEGPRSIHGYFLVSHERVRKLADCVRQRCSDQARETALQQAEQALNELGIAVEEFVRDCTASIHERAGAS